MAKIKDTRHKALVDFHKQVAATISSLKKPTKDSVESAFTNAAPSDIRALIAYTGYYSMSTAKGAFLSIDTNENFYQISKPVTVSVAFITITVSTYFYRRLLLLRWENENEDIVNQRHNRFF